jgi:hypothetical protein
MCNAPLYLKDYLIFFLLRLRKKTHPNKDAIHTQNIAWRKILNFPRGRRNETFNVSCKSNLIPDCYSKLKQIFFSYFQIFNFFFSLFNLSNKFCWFLSMRKRWIKLWFTTIMIKDKDFLLKSVRVCNHYYLARTSQSIC